MMGEPERCMLFLGHPPGTSAETIAHLLVPYNLRKSAVGSAVRLKYTPGGVARDRSESGKHCLVEFASKAEAHRAYRNLAHTVQQIDDAKFVLNVKMMA